MSPAEKLERYVQWNQLTRHQLIVAHMTLIEELEEAQSRLTTTFELPYQPSLHGVVSAVIEQMAALRDAASGKRK